MTRHDHTVVTGPRPGNGGASTEELLTVGRFAGGTAGIAVELSLYPRGPDHGERIVQTMPPRPRNRPVYHWSGIAASWPSGQPETIDEGSVPDCDADSAPLSIEAGLPPPISPAEGGHSCGPVSHYAIENVSLAIEPELLLR